WASDVYCQEIFRSGQRGTVFERMHRMLLESPPGKQDPLIVGPANAVATINERLISSATGMAEPAGLGANIPDEVCAAYAAMVPYDGTPALGPGFAPRVRALLDTPRQLAAAALCAFAAQMVSPNDPILRALIGEVHAAAQRGPYLRIPTQLCFAAEPAT